MEHMIIDILKRVIASCEKLVEFYSTLQNIKENPSDTKCNCGDDNHCKSLGQKMAETEITAEIKVLKKSFNLLFGTMETK
tara:strand:+ start:1053 stop:1292 length:240 start_codon:yes stop_codon:yes gene_type:complete